MMTSKSKSCHIECIFDFFRIAPIRLLLFVCVLSLGNVSSIDAVEVGLRPSERSVHEGRLTIVRLRTGRARSFRDFFRPIHVHMRLEKGSSTDHDGLNIMRKNIPASGAFSHTYYRFFPYLFAIAHNDTVYHDNAVFTLRLLSVHRGRIDARRATRSL